MRVVLLIKNKLFRKETELSKYYNVSKDLYSKDIIKEDTFEKLKETYIFSKEHDSKQKGKDDFDREIKLKIYTFYSIMVLRNSTLKWEVKYAD